MLDTDTLRIRKGVSQSLDPETAARELHAAIGQENVSLAFFYCSPQYDLEALGRELARRFAGVNLIGCTTAGEITPEGYLDGALTGASISSDDFTAVTERIDGLSAFEFADGARTSELLVAELDKRGKTPSPRTTFGFLLIDGLSLQEEVVISALSRSLGNMPLFGGSAGDGVRFGETFIYHDGAFHTDAAVFTLVVTTHPFEVFKTEHFIATDDKMVVTGADVGRRIVMEINGLPAGREYARMVGLEVDKLTPMIFATYPVVVKVGDDYFVRSIQKVNEDESLTFFCAIDEGIVLTVGRGVDLAENLEQAFRRVRNKIGKPRLVIGCDCILRNLELDQKGLKETVGGIMADNNVIGFSTYGEQFNAMHVNQTFTGVAIGERM